MVDDSVADRELCRNWLEQRCGPSLEFFEASSGNQGAAMCLSTPLDCVLLDCGLPDMNSLDFLSTLRAGKKSGAVTDLGIVMLTAPENEQVALDAMKAGAQDYLVKDRMTAAGLCLAIERTSGKVGMLRALQTERDRLAAALLEKEALLQEVHHRVKNNLEVIASLLRLQAGEAADADAVDALRDSAHRVESMALIHDQLYGTQNHKEIDMARHVQSLTARLAESYGIDGDRVAWRVCIEPLPLTVAQAIPAGLIVNELISNALKHAFPGERHGSLVVSGARNGDRISLEVRDDGVGLLQAAGAAPGAAGERPPKPFGLEIVRILTRQLQGTFEIEYKGGATCRLSFSAA